MFENSNIPGVFRNTMFHVFGDTTTVTDAEILAHHMNHIIITQHKPCANNNNDIIIIIL